LDANSTLILLNTALSFLSPSAALPTNKIRQYTPQQDILTSIYILEQKREWK
jgi:hypothetical protein